MTEFVFRDDSYIRSIPTLVTAVTPEGGIVLDRTVFYATSGGQPGDTGRLELADGSFVDIAGTIHPDGDKTTIVHVPAEGQRALSRGDEVIAHIDWERRHKLMRMHTALHLLTVALPHPVTGASVSEDKGAGRFQPARRPRRRGNRAQAERTGGSRLPGDLGMDHRCRARG